MGKSRFKAESKEELARLLLGGGGSLSYIPCASVCIGNEWRFVGFIVQLGYRGDDNQHRR